MECGHLIVNRVIPHNCDCLILFIFKDVRVESASCGWDFSILISTDRRIFGCGSNGFGQLARSVKDAKQFNLFEEIQSLRNRSALTTFKCSAELS
jgi:alpha-tubulin suppressor-like RCC1 family protein